MRALAAYQCGPGSYPCVDVICGLSLLLILSSAPRGFPLSTPVYPSPQKPTFPNSNSTRNQVDEEPLWGCATSQSSLFIIYLFIYLFITIDCFSQIQVSGNIPCHLGALLLTASNVRVLGGSVQMLEGNSYWNVLHQAM